jgi:hypothetical protein
MYFTWNRVNVTLHKLLWTVLGIRIGFNADPDPVFNLNADPDPGSQTNADTSPDPGQIFTSQKVEFFTDKYPFL